jgi:hypothetical protein
LEEMEEIYKTQTNKKILLYAFVTEWTDLSFIDNIHIALNIRKHNRWSSNLGIGPTNGTMKNR